MLAPGADVARPPAGRNKAPNSSLYRCSGFDPCYLALGFAGIYGAAAAMLERIMDFSLLASTSI